MASFVDNQKKKWVIAVEPLAVRAVESEVGVSLFDSSIDAKLADPLTLIDVVSVLCRADCKDAGIDEESFGRRCVGKIEDISAALSEAIADFFGGQRGEHIRELVAVQKEMIRQQMEQSIQEMKELPEKLSKQAKSGEKSGTLLDRLASLPGDSNSENLSGPPKDGKEPSGQLVQN